MKTVLQMHGLEWQRSRWGKSGSVVLKFLERLAVRQATAITAVSRKQCAYLHDRYGCNADYIPTATQVHQRVAPERILKVGLVPGKYALLTSRLVREKGVHTLILAFRKTAIDMKLVIAGDSNGDQSYREQLKEIARGDDRILFTGYVEGQLLAELFSNAYVYVQPSTVEGLSIALLEAMSYGRCCLVSDIPENLEPLDGTGYSFRTGDIEHLASMLQWLSQNPQCVHGIQRRVVQRVQREFSWESVASKMESLYAELLSRTEASITVPRTTSL